MDAVNDSTPLDIPAMRAAQSEWRKRGALGKVHNIVVLHSSEAFEKITVDDISDSKPHTPQTANFQQG